MEAVFFALLVTGTVEKRVYLGRDLLKIIAKERKYFSFYHLFVVLRGV